MMVLKQGILILVVVTAIFISGCLDGGNNGGSSSGDYTPSVSEVTITIGTVYENIDEIGDPYNTLSFCNSKIDFEKLHNYAYYKIDGVRQPSGEGCYEFDIGIYALPNFVRPSDYPMTQCFGIGSNFFVEKGAGSMHEFEICWTHTLDDCQLNKNMACKSAFFITEEEQTI